MNQNDCWERAGAIRKSEHARKLPWSATDGDFALVKRICLRVDRRSPNCGRRRASNRAGHRVALEYQGQRASALFPFARNLYVAGVHLARVRAADRRQLQLYLVAALFYGADGDAFGVLIEAVESTGKLALRALSHLQYQPQFRSAGIERALPFAL